MKQIAIDLDSTLNNLEEVWLSEYNKRYNDNLTRDHMNDWDLSWARKCTPQDMHKMLMEPRWFAKLGVRPYVQEVVKELAAKHELFIATAYHHSTCVDKTEWIHKHLPMINDRHIIFINPKHLLNTDYLIDDGPHNIVDFKQTPIIMDAPWNRHLGDDYIRMNNWLEIGDYFADEENQLTIYDFLQETHPNT